MRTKLQYAKVHIEGEFDPTCLSREWADSIAGIGKIGEFAIAKSASVFLAERVAIAVRSDYADAIFERFDGSKVPTALNILGSFASILKPENISQVHYNFSWSLSRSGSARSIKGKSPVCSSLIDTRKLVDKVEDVVGSPLRMGTVFIFEKAEFLVGVRAIPVFFSDDYEFTVFFRRKLEGQPKRVDDAIQAFPNAYELSRELRKRLG
jgi:hypothetical protein